MNVAFIPVRGGSKSIPLKNIREIAGKPLVYWGIQAANNCKDIDVVYVATDNTVIKETIEHFGFNKVMVVGRSEESASDTATTEFAMLEFADNYDFDTITLIQATSPLLTSEDLAGGFREFHKQGTDSVLSVVRQKRFYWQTDDKGFAAPLNYDIFHRPRRQEFNGFLVENGAFYITSREALLVSKNRVSGNIRVYEMEESAYHEVDEPSDWPVIECQLINKYGRQNKSDVVVPEIKMFLTDCDGCLTDGGMYYSENGDELKKFNALDGMGLALLKKKGILTGVITGEQRALNRRRVEKLRLDIYREGISNKLSVVKQLCKKYDIFLQNVAYLGDDVNDIEVIRAVGFGCCAINGVQKAKEAAVYVTNRAGGQGAVREVIDIIMGNYSL